MRMDKLTSRFQQALAEAQSLAVGRDNPQMEPAHVMQAMLDQEGGSTAPLLEQAAVNIDVLRSKLDTLLDAMPKLKDATGEVQVGHDLSRLLNLSDKLAQQKKDQANHDAITKRVDAVNKKLSPWINLVFVVGILLLLLYLVPATALTGQTIGKRIFKVRRQSGSESFREELKS